MSGVWNFKAGVMRVVENPLAEVPFADTEPGPSPRRKILVHIASNQTMTSFGQLDGKLLELGWHPYHGGESTVMRQYHLSSCSADLITLPPIFSSLRTTHMYDIVVKSRSAFQVRDA